MAQMLQGESSAHVLQHDQRAPKPSSARLEAARLTSKQSSMLQKQWVSLPSRPLLTGWTPALQHQPWDFKPWMSLRQVFPSPAVTVQTVKAAAQHGARHHHRLRERAGNAWKHCNISSQKGLEFFTAQLHLIHLEPSEPPITQSIHLAA